MTVGILIFLILQLPLVLTRPVRQVVSTVTVGTAEEFYEALQNGNADLVIDITSSGIRLEDTLTIDKPGISITSANGTLLTCPEEGSALRILSAGVHISGVQFTGCVSSAVEVSVKGGRPIEFENVAFLNNALDGYFTTGGGLQIAGCASSNCAVKKAHTAKVNLRNCRFEGNSAGVGGGIYAENAHLSLSQCLFLNNTAKQAGGALHITGAGSSLSIRSCVFDQNRVTSSGADDEVVLKGGLPLEPFQYFRFQFPNANGGAIAVRSISETTIASCNFTGNQAPAGGAISIDSRWEAYPTRPDIQDSVQIEDSVFKGNAALDAADRERMYLMGGAIYAVSSREDFELTLEGCEFLDNSAFHGGAVHLATLLTARPLISNSLFFGNQAASMGGAILLRNTGMLTLTACNLTENHARIGGGILLTNNAMLLVRGLAGLAPSTRVDLPSVFHGNQAERGGAVACVGCGDAILQDTVVANNVASEIGGGIYGFDTSASLHLLQNRFEGNRAATGGGAAFEAVARVRFTSAEESLRTVFSNNTAASGSALFYVASHLKENRLVIADTECRFNDATSAGSTLQHSAGGTIQLVLDDVPVHAVADVLLKDVHIHDNAAGFAGGIALHVDGEWNDNRTVACPPSMLSTDPCRHLRFVNVTIVENTADEAPGLFLTDSRTLDISCDSEETWISLYDILQRQGDGSLTSNDLCPLYNDNFISGTADESNIAVSDDAF